MTDEELVQEAIKYREHSYSPYSHFAVGAAVLTKSGHVYGGCNIENASYPVGICAERTAIVKAVSEGERDIVALAVVGDTPGPCSPCGMCRQFIGEFKIPRIIMANLHGVRKTVTLEELLPFAFTDSDM
ncbi:cytidine deaminase [Selenomonas sp.]|uniref:cytidine deaminase n=1 Tax=Selenomonas sp. TaxID=2053611 RepID=UPI002A752924|nr:cytidine deaminase [Selenomonas sp.]MDY3298081.1 cytidine deaminase [Selenomonas sp.]MDY4415531.1 cytidine deaminase [Selenomonas sp.]